MRLGLEMNIKHSALPHDLGSLTLLLVLYLALVFPDCTARKMVKIGSTMLHVFHPIL